MSDPLNQVAARYLAERHRLIAFILAGVRDPHTAEDIFQEVWLRLAKEAQSGTLIRDEASWCRAAARNLLLHHWRQEQRTKVEANSDLLEVLDSLEAALVDDPLPNDACLARQQALTECLVRLPERARRLLSLKYEAGLPLGDIAREIGLSLPATTKTLYRLRRALMECVQSRIKLSEAGL